jgi:carboxylate-amine ligase
MRCSEDFRKGEPLPEARHELVRAAAWRAARYGLGADLIDVVGRQAAPAADVVARLLAYLRPALATTGDADAVSEQVARLIESGTGAARQRAVFDERACLSDVVDFIVDETRP